MSVPFSLSDAINWTGGRSSAEDDRIQFPGVGIDTRSLHPGDLFVAIRGERHDAHGFLPDALAAGAGGLMLEAAWLGEHSPNTGLPVVAVEDTTRALGALARGHRDRFEGPVIAVTGSNGKTSTKEMIHCILSVPGPCLKNPGNLNNEYGLPLSLLARAEEERTAVVELGMNHRGEIARLAAIARPDIAVITNIGTAHIEFFKDQAEIALEKGDLVAALEPTGVAVLNRDDALAFDQGGRVRGRTMSFGRHADADVRAEDVTIEEGGLFSFRLLFDYGAGEKGLDGLRDG